jgi:PAS domain S-box-containing protein
MQTARATTSAQSEREPRPPRILSCPIVFPSTYLPVDQLGHVVGDESVPTSPTPASGHTDESVTSRVDVRGVATSSFQSVVESVKDYAIFMLDREGRVQTWNAGAELIKGYAPQEIVGRKSDVFYTTEDRDRQHADSLLVRAAANGRVEEEGWRVRKNGQRFWADVVITARVGSSGEVVGFTKVTRDLSERREAEEQRRRRDEDLLRSEERFRLLVDAVKDHAIVMLDPSGCVATWNGGAERLEGYSAEEIIGQHQSRFRSDEDVRSGKCEEQLAIAARDGRSEEEGWRVCKDGRRFWASVVLSAIRDGSGALVGFAEVTRDLTERRRLDEERLGRVAAEAMTRLKDEFLSIASHELKTPLTALQIEVQALQRHLGEPLHAEARGRVARVSRSVGRLASLMDSLLDVTRIEAGQVVLRVEPVDLAEVIAHVIESLRPTALNAGCDVTLTTADEPVNGEWDRLRLEQIFSNLLSNAFKYGAGRPVGISLSRSHANVSVEVSDGGPGIPARDLERIFGRFERATINRHQSGLGLGLYVCRNLVEAHCGEIAVRNLAGAGACFTVRLPVRTAATSVVGKVDADAAG